MSASRIALLVFGVIFLVGALVLMAAGVGLMWISQGLESDSPAFASGETRLRKADAYAIVTDPFQIDWYDDSQTKGWGLADLITAKVEAESRDPAKGVFIGIAREADVDEYLTGVRYYEVAEWSSDPFVDTEVEYVPHGGSAAPSVPTAETFWEASIHGAGRQTLDWKPEIGRWVIVFMNEDGSAGVDVSGALGAELPWLFWLGLALLPLGVAVVFAGGVLVYLAARRPKRRVTPLGEPTPGTA